MSGLPSLRLRVFPKIHKLVQFMDSENMIFHKGIHCFFSDLAEICIVLISNHIINGKQQFFLMKDDLECYNAD